MIHASRIWSRVWVGYAGKSRPEYDCYIKSGAEKLGAKVVSETFEYEGEHQYFAEFVFEPYIELSAILFWRMLNGLNLVGTYPQKVSQLTEWTSKKFQGEEIYE